VMGWMMNAKVSFVIECPFSLCAFIVKQNTPEKTNDLQTLLPVGFDFFLFAITRIKTPM
jgi:hypothetical protein